MPELVLVRGLPGAGKTTHSKKHFSHYKHFEADLYFISKKTGEYKFDCTKLNAAHKWCQEQTYNSLRNGHDTVVSNTFISAWELDSYLSIITQLLLEHNVEVSLRVVEMKTQYQNIHGVPAEKLEIMRNRWHDWETIKEDCGLNDENCIYEVVE
jgi:predicted kinase